MAGSNTKEGAELCGEGTELQKHPFGSSKPPNCLVLAAEVQLAEDGFIGCLCLQQPSGPFPPCNYPCAHAASPLWGRSFATEGRDQVRIVKNLAAQKVSQVLV